MTNTKKQLMQHRGPERPERSKSRAGTSIVEALIALTIFAIFITGACKLLLSHRQLTDMARAHYQAANIAKNRLELVRSFDFDQRVGFAESKVVVNNMGIPSRNGKYRRSTTFANTSSNIVELAVSVDILDRKSLAFEGRAETVKSYYALNNSRPES